MLAGATKLGITGDESQPVRSACFFGAGTIAAVGVPPAAASTACGVGARRGGACGVQPAAHRCRRRAHERDALRPADRARPDRSLTARARRADPHRAKGAARARDRARARRRAPRRSLLLAPLALPACWRGSVSRRLGWSHIAVAARTVCVIAPWTARNLERLRPSGAHLDQRRHRARRFQLRCNFATERDFRLVPDLHSISPAPPTGNEAEQAARYRSDGASYATDHLGRLPTRRGRARAAAVWGLYQPSAALAYDAQNEATCGRAREAGGLLSSPAAPACRLRWRFCRAQARQASAARSWQRRSF